MIVSITDVKCPECRPDGDVVLSDQVHLSRLNVWLARCGHVPVLESDVPKDLIVEAFVEPDDPRDMEMMGS